jgi:monoamine oxidase
MAGTKRGPSRRSVGRTPLFDAFRRAFEIARRAVREDAPPVDELVEMRAAALTRREFLRASAAVGVAVGGGQLERLVRPLAPPPTVRSLFHQPRVVVVGAGMAGLNAALKLQRAGVRAVIYEASRRSGGRMYTARDLMAPGLTTELGGEFIDPYHDDVLALVEEFELDLIDVRSPSEAELYDDAFFFNGRHYSETEVIEALLPLIPSIEADIEALEAVEDFYNDPVAVRLDRMSIAEFLTEIGASGWLYELLEVAYVTEYGLDAGEQSALNLLFLFSTDLSAGFEPFGPDAERYKVLGGNQRLTDVMAEELDGQIMHEHALEAIKLGQLEGYELTFQRPNGGVKRVRADVVVLALPFTLLREVKIEVALPPVKWKAVAELGYGTNAKVFLGVQRRVWRDLGYGGNVLTDEELQLGWDNSRLQSSAEGGFTLFSGGRRGVAVGVGTAESHVARMLPGLEKIYPGVTAQFNGRVGRFHWPSHPWTRGSYACYRPGQWTTMYGVEGEAVGNLIFAGEHCSLEYQGYMNGAAETGRLAAEAVLERLGYAKRKAVGRKAVGGRSLRPAFGGRQRLMRAER